ncbi:MAG: PDDEXK nuclease domain-containing protein, partial [archaeon]|nr:PDDEXK nuclease domain-containing protein [archaeon]
EPELTGYNNLLADIDSILHQGLSKAYKAVDNLKVQTYWQIGERIVREELEHKDRAGYGKNIIDNLAKDLGIGKVNLHYMVRFYTIYPIIQTVSEQLSWSHLVELIYVENKDERKFYEIQSIKNMWSVRQLKNQIRSDLYVRMKTQGKLLNTRSIQTSPTLPERLFKDTYNFDFLALDRNHTETDLENALILNAEKLLIEFGSDFSVSGRQRKIIIDGQIHTVDIEFYHRGVPCIVLVDLKTGKFKSEYVGQMNKYLNWYKEHKRYSWEKDPVGLIICRNKGAEEVHYALGGISNHIFISEYRVKLPSEEKIEEAFEKSESYRL